MHVGDFNLGHLNWNLHNSVAPFDVSSNMDSLLLEFVSLNNLIKLNNIFNANSRILNLVLVSKGYCTKLIEVDCPIFDKTYHSPAIVELSAIN